YSWTSDWNVGTNLHQPVPRPKYLTTGPRGPLLEVVSAVNLRLSRSPSGDMGNKLPMSKIRPVQTAEHCQHRRRLNPTLRSDDSQKFEESLRDRVVGQEEGIRAVANLYQVFRADMCPAGRPVGNLLF